MDVIGGVVVCVFFGICFCKEFYGLCYFYKVYCVVGCRIVVDVKVGVGFVGDFFESI